MKIQFVYAGLMRMSVLVSQRILRAYHVDFIAVIFLFCMSSVAMAVPSQYCSKLSAHMQNLICDIKPHDDGTLLSLDYQVSLVYEFALFSSKSSAKLKKNQRLKKNYAKTEPVCLKVTAIEFVNLKLLLMDIPINQQVQKIVI